VIDIKSLRGLDAHRSADAELAARLAELESEADGRPFSEGQLGEFQSIISTREELAGIIEELQLRHAAVEAASKQPNATESVGGPVTAPNIIKAPDDIFDMAAYRQRSIDDLPQAYRDGAMRVIEKAALPATKDQDAARARLAELVDKHQNDGHGVVARRVIATTSPSYTEAWARYISGGMENVPPRLQAALQTYSDANGGVAIPVTIDPTFILTTDGQRNDIRDMARVETITTKEWSPVTTAGVTAAYAAETAAATDGAPTDIDDPTITPIRAHVFVSFTAEYSEDYGPAAIQSEVGRMIGDAKTVLEANKFVLGTGSSEPLGVVFKLNDDGTSLVATANDNAFALVDVDAVEGALGDRFIGNAQWLAARKVYQTVRGFGTAGQPANSIYDQLSGTLRGYPARHSNVMDKTFANDDLPLLFGDFRQFVIVDRLGLSTEFVPQVFDGNGNPLGRRGIYARWRNNTGLTTVNAFRLLKIGVAGS
jgi:HK97 family phage major capsid protein